MSHPRKNHTVWCSSIQASWYEPAIGFANAARSPPCAAEWTAPAMLEAQVVGSQPARGAVPRDRWNVSSYSRGGMFPQ